MRNLYQKSSQTEIKDFALWEVGITNTRNQGNFSTLKNKT